MASKRELQECPVYHPSTQDFDDPFLYLQTIASQASKFGICKIVSPMKASVAADTVLTEEIKGFKFETIVQPLGPGTATFFRRGKKYKYREFEAKANNAFLRRFSGDAPPSADALEDEFWRQMANGKKGAVVEYGLNIEASAFSSNPRDHFAKTKWNLRNLSRLPGSLLRFLQGSIPGITDPMLYIGMVFSTFAWHVEDHYLYSINYHHSGAPKTWYGVPADFATRLEKLVLEHVYTISSNSEDEASKLLAEKTTMFPPQLLVEHNIPVYKALQMPGEFVITFPKAYHAGFSHGFNCGEAVNFATGSWFEFGAEASQRYARVRIVPIIPLEELVCIEAMVLYQQSPNREGLDFKAQLPTKLSFVRIVRFYEKALQSSTGMIRGSSSVTGTTICSICKRDCYLAYMICNSCSSYSACLNHVWDTGMEWTACSCGSTMRVFVREDMSTYTDAAQKFEMEFEQAMKAYSKGRSLKGKSKVEVDTESGKEKLRRKNGLNPQLYSKL